MVVYQTDQSVSQTSTANTEVRYRLIDFGGATPVVTLSGVTVDPTPVGATLDREYPAVTQVSSGGQSSWIVEELMASVIPRRAAGSDRRWGRRGCSRPRVRRPPTVR